MENKLDKLFKDHLSKHEVRPTQEAWNQIHDQLKSKRKAIWIKRMAIAASFMLIATVGFLGYRATDEVDLTSGSKTISLNNEKETKLYSAEIREEEPDEKTNNLSENTSETDKDKEVTTAGVDVDNVIGNDVRNAVPEAKGGLEQESLLIASGELEEAVESTPDIEKGLEEKGIVKPELQETIALAAQKDQGAAIERNEQKTKVYPKVKIIYKASQNSELVYSGKQTLINKGIDKITEFSGEHLLTTDRKTKLRNTKDDLLALNFGKLLNKSNKDVEN